MLYCEPNRSWIVYTHCPAGAPSKQVGIIARAFQQEEGAGMPSAGVAAASKVHSSHGERDCHRAFRRFGLSLRIPVSELQVPAEGGPIKVPHLKVTHFFSKLLKKHPKLLYGGFKLGDQSRQLCRQFWQRFKLYQPDHKIYEVLPSEQDWEFVLPICLHGDKGRGRSKLPCFVFSFESCFGLPKAVREAGPAFQTPGVHGNKLQWTCGKRKRDQCPDLHEPPGADTACQLHGPDCFHDGSITMPHNGRGNTHLTKFLCAAIPHKVFSSNENVVPCMLRELRDSLTTLFQDGIEYEGHTYRCALVGVKGDLEFQHEAACFDRCYTRLGVVRNYGMCPECHAGEDAHPYTDVGDVPSWSTTLHQTLPWQVTPILNEVPFSDSRPATLYRRDPFHILKFGFLKDLAACLLLELASFKMFDSDAPEESIAVDARLQRAFSWFKLWLLAERRHSTLRKFSLSTLHRTKSTSFPFLAGKGADAVLVLMFLDFFMTLRLSSQTPEMERCLKARLETVQGALHFTGVHHSHELFVPSYCAQFLYLSGMRLLRGYCFLAQENMNCGKRLYNLRPKLHYFHHVLWDLKAQIEASHRYILCPIAFGCEANEDYIGRICRLARKVSPRLCGQRTIDRYLVHCQLLFRKHGV